MIDFLPQNSLPLLRRGPHDEISGSGSVHRTHHQQSYLQSSCAEDAYTVNYMFEAKDSTSNTGQDIVADVGAISQRSEMHVQQEEESVVSPPTEEAKAQLHDKKSKHRQKFLYRINA